MNDKLIERITQCLEEYGMPKFQDRFAALSIIQLFKDSGWTPPIQTSGYSTEKPKWSLEDTMRNEG